MIKLPKGKRGSTISITRDKPPCPPQCPRRTPGCQGTCEGYAKYRQKREAEYKYREEHCTERYYEFEDARRRKRIREIQP